MSGGALSRLADRARGAPAVLRSRSARRQASRDERRALRALGAGLVAAAGPLPPAASAARGEVASLDEVARTLGDELTASLALDRRDYAAVAGWLRPLVIARGLATRQLLRHRLRRLARRREDSLVHLGAAAAADSSPLPPATATLLAAVLEAQERRDAAAAAEERLLAPLGGRLLPAPAGWLAAEARAFGSALLREGRSQVVPRLPALVGLAAGAWVARTFTESGFLATLHSWGIGSGPRLAVSPGTYRLLAWGLPLLAAATFSYASSRVAGRVRARYGDDVRHRS